MRKSAASYEIIQAVIPDQRPEPPSEFSASEIKVWHQIVRSMPSDWFTNEMLPVLSALCLNIILNQKMAEKLRKLDPCHKSFHGLARLNAQYTELINRTSAVLRLTPQSRYNANAARKATKEAVAARQQQPWDDSVAA